MTTASIPLRDWEGERTLIQGCRTLGNQVVVAQADDVAGQKIQDTRFRVHDKAFKYTELACLVKHGGHCSSFGALTVGGKLNVLFGHETLGLVRVPLVDGKGSPIPIPGAPNGTWTCDQEFDLACVRQGTTYTIFTLSSVLKGSPKQIARTVVPSFYERFQGHYVTKIDGKLTLLIHGDNGTKKHSEARLLTVSGSKWRTLAKINTTGMGDEAEGFDKRNNRIVIVKRTGGAGAGRVLELTFTNYRTKPAGIGVYKVHGTGKGWMYARQIGVPKPKWEQRDDGFKVTTGESWVWRKFPDLPVSERYLKTRADRYYRAKYLQKVA